jgi:predicted glycosyltransferase
MKVRLQEGDNTVNLKFDFRTSGDMVTMASAAALLGIDSVYFVTVLRAIRTRKSPKAS